MKPINIRISDLYFNIQRIRRNLASVPFEEEILRRRLGILSELLACYEQSINEHKTDLISKFESDVLLYAHWVYANHEAAKSILATRMAKTTEKTNEDVPPLPVRYVEKTQAGLNRKILIRDHVTEKEFFLEITNFREEERFNHDTLEFIVFIGKPIAKAIINQRVGFTFDIHHRKHEVLAIYGKE